jgi:DNA-binding response OmpR family regulator
MNPSGMLVVFPDPPTADLARTLDLAGYRWKAVNSISEAATCEPTAGWSGAIVACDEDPEAGWAFVRALRKRDAPVSAVIVLVNGAQLADLELRDELFDDFILSPFHPREMEARLRHLFWASTGTTRAEVIETSGLVLNLETYQASFEGKSGKVFTRETLLSRVWGYEYYGGARTVDVHIRRLRAKLGEEHANLIQTVRSVGYSFGQVRRGS